MNVPSVIAFPASTITPSVQTSARLTVTTGSTTPRTVRYENQSTSRTNTSAMGVKRVRSRRMSSTADCFTCAAPV